MTDDSFVQKGFRIQVRTYEVIIVGDSGCGKTSILMRYMDDLFEATIPTIGVDSRKKSVFLDENDEICLRIWDTAGQEKYGTLTKSFFRRAEAIVVVFDVTCLGSFDNVGRWLLEIEDNCEKKVPKFLVANKMDIEETSRSVTSEMSRGLADIHSIPFFEVSAKTGENIDELFDEISNTLVKYDPLRKTSSQEEIVQIVREEPEVQKKRRTRFC